MKTVNQMKAFIEKLIHLLREIEKFKEQLEQELQQQYNLQHQLQEDNNR